MFNVQRGTVELQNCDLQQKEESLFGCPPKQRHHRMRQRDYAAMVSYFHLIAISPLTLPSWTKTTFSLKTATTRGVLSPPLHPFTSSAISSSQLLSEKGHDHGPSHDIERPKREREMTSKETK